MASWTVVLRGIRHRPGRSLIVLLLTALATAATVLAPGYSRAAQQAVLTNGLASAPVTATGIEIRSEPLAGEAPAVESVGDAKSEIRLMLRGSALESHFEVPVGGADVDTVLTPAAGAPARARLAFRDGVCRHLTIAAGACPDEPGSALVSQRSAAQHGLAVGDAVTIRAGDGSGATGPDARRFTVAGLYVPADPNEAYWGRGGFFAAGPPVGDSTMSRLDAVFVGDEEDVALPGKVPTVYLDYRLRVDTVRLDNVGRLGSDLASFETDVNAAQLRLSTALRGVLADIDAENDALGRTVPMIAVPLVLLCWFVLFLLATALTEERAPEIALAKLRGFSLRRSASFGRSELFMLVALATPIGLLAGLAVVELAARVMLATDVHVEPRPPVLGAAVLGTLAAIVAIRLAGRRTLTRPVLDLLRRVPARGPWRAGMAEGIVIALAGASLAAAVSDQSAPLALLAPALLAVVAGILTARMLGLWSRIRIGRHARRGRLAALLAHAQLSRRPLGQRVMVVVTVAVALLSFAATAWDVAAQARRDVATDTVGAQRVVRVAAAHPAALTAAVAAAVPGEAVMSVVRVTERYGTGTVELLGVQSERLADVVIWRGRDAAELADLAGRLRPRQAPALLVTGFVEAVVAVDALAGSARLAAVVAPPGEPARRVDLGPLGRGQHGYRAALPGCAGGCRLLGLALERPGGTTAPVTAVLRIGSVVTEGGPVAAAFDVAGRWRADPARAPRATVVVSPGAFLTIEVSSTETAGPIVIEYADTPDALPVAIAGPTPADDPSAGEFTFPALGEQPQRFSVVERHRSLPRVGEAGLLFDLDYAVRAAERTSALSDSTRLNYEVWASPQAPADLADRLAAAGLQVLGENTVEAELARLSRAAPALGLRLYLVAGMAAVALAVGAVVLTAYIGSQARRYELAALRVAGVRPRVLRRGLLREYLHLVGLPLVVGVAAGLAGAAVMLPGLSLVTVGSVTGEIDYDPAAGLLPVAAAVTLAGLVFAVLLVLRTVHRATPDRLREGA